MEHKNKRMKGKLIELKYTQENQGEKVTEVHKIRDTQENQDENEPEVDRISFLPQPIIHHIMSLLPTRYAARTSTLSHKWNILWLTFPVIDLYEDDFLDLDKFRLSDQKKGWRDLRERFIKYLQFTLSRRCMINLDSLAIKISTPCNSEIYHEVDKLVEAAMKGKLKKLDLLFVFDDSRLGCGLSYKLSEEIFLCGQALLSLRLRGCNMVCLDKNIGVSFHVLNKLFIENARMDGSFLERVIQGCPSLESFFLVECNGLKSFTIYHSRMRQFVLKRCKHLEKFTVDAPSLKSFKYQGYCFHNENGDFRFSDFNSSHDVLRFSHLDKLTLKWVSMNADTFNHMISSFPNLKFLKMRKCKVFGKPRLSGDNLKQLVMSNCYFGEIFELRACNLEVLTFTNSINCFTICTNGFKFITNVLLDRISELTGKDLQLFIGSSKHLRSLVVESCSKLDHVKIVSRTLEYLAIFYCMYVEVVRIFAPNLTFLKYNGVPLSLKHSSRLFTSNKLVAELTMNCYPHCPIDDSEQYQIREFLQLFFGYTKSLSYNSLCYKCLMKLNTSSEPPPLDYLYSLKVKKYLRGQLDLVDLLQSMLGFSVCRKSMCIDRENSSTIQLEFKEITLEERSGQRNSAMSHDCIKDHLLEVMIPDFSGNLEELKFIKFLVCNAQHLKKLMIFVNKYSCFKLMSWINNLPKASSDAEIIFSLSYS